MRSKSMVLAVALLAGGALFAGKAPEPKEGPREQGPRPERAAEAGRPPRPGLLGVLRRLDLSKEQKDKLKSLRQARADKMKAAFREAREARKEMEDLLVQPSSSDKNLQELRRKQENLMALQQKAEREAFEGLLEVRAVLTGEQLKRAGEIMKERRERPGREDEAAEERGPGGPRPEGPDDDDEDEDASRRPPRERRAERAKP